MVALTQFSHSHSALIWRVDRQHLREGAKVIVDIEDQKTFQEVLDGTYVESTPPPHTGAVARIGTCMS